MNFEKRHENNVVPLLPTDLYTSILFTKLIWVSEHSHGETLVLKCDLHWCIGTPDKAKVYFNSKGIKFYLFIYFG